MTNQETITKLNEALNTLIKAYEELQNENTLLEEKIDNLNKDKKELEAKVTSLEDKNRNLEDNVNELNDSTEKQNNNINSMLGKIENLLGSKKNPNKYEKDNNKFDSKEKGTFIKEEDNSKNSSLDQILEEEIDNTSANFRESSSNSENKIDLNRMASLLNGFNN
ncbi:hypothetical protein [Malaciobacter marinus]|jgi:phage-related tail protein|uniref:hypothetical protein n=1 Tax=Malaciobacter TaxID=2321114 RepID=UPI0009A5B9D7|nr:hypothetical protein [Malaciobacter marinus]SKB66277.1 hypothetical protein SAMN06295997_12822 [Malaciobacter marinus]